MKNSTDSTHAMHQRQTESILCRVKFDICAALPLPLPLCVSVSLQNHTGIFKTHMLLFFPPSSELKTSHRLAHVCIHSRSKEPSQPFIRKVFNNDMLRHDKRGRRVTSRLLFTRNFKSMHLGDVDITFSFLFFQTRVRVLILSTAVQDSTVQ